MRVIDKGYDKLLWSKYELCASTLVELRDLAKSWYEDIDFSQFDDRFLHNVERDKNTLIEMKRSGLTSNYFFAYRDQSGKHYLMDGFNRLFTSYGDLGDLDVPVYIKIITDKLEDWKLMHIMFRLNMWKLQGGGSQHSLRIDDFFDRGFRLFLSSKFGLNIYSNANNRHGDTAQSKNDFRTFNKYFRCETEGSGDFPYELDEFSVLLSRETIVDDLKYISEINKICYSDYPFNNYSYFFDGFIMYLSSIRVLGDISEHKLEYYYDLLKKDKKFFDKLQSMSGTDSTRKNMYKWFRSL